jgi:hypothetical protein
MKRIGLSIGLFAMGLLVSSVASAQAAAAAAGPAPEAGGAHTHDGFFLRLGLNFGPLIASAKTEVNGTEGPEVDYSGLHIGNELLIGGSPTPGLAIGGALLVAQTKDPTVKTDAGEGEADGTMLFAGIAAFGNYYFDPSSGGHLQLMLGFAAADFVSDSGNSGGNDPSGVMVGLGGGYDFWIGDEWSVGPFARVVYSPMSVEDAGVKYKYSYLNPSIGVTFTYH